MSETKVNGEQLANSNEKGNQDNQDNQDNQGNKGKNEPGQKRSPQNKQGSDQTENKISAKDNYRKAFEEYVAAKKGASSLDTKERQVKSKLEYLQQKELKEKQNLEAINRNAKLKEETKKQRIEELKRRKAELDAQKEEEERQKKEIIEKKEERLKKVSESKKKLIFDKKIGAQEIKEYSQTATIILDKRKKCVGNKSEENRNLRKVGPLVNVREKLLNDRAEELRIISEMEERRQKKLKKELDKTTEEKEKQSKQIEDLKSESEKARQKRDEELMKLDEEIKNLEEELASYKEEERSGMYRDTKKNDTSRSPQSQRQQNVSKTQ